MKPPSCEALVEVGDGLARCGKPAEFFSNAPNLGASLVAVCCVEHAPHGRTVQFTIPKETPGSSPVGKRERR